MGLFSRNFEKPGPGVPKDMPRKKGAARFFELLFRDFGDLIKLNILFCLTVLPSATAFVFGAGPFLLERYELNLVFLLLSLILAFPIGGAVVAYVYYISKMMRDDPSYVWYEFKRKFKENVRQAAPAGIICTAFIYMQIIMWFQVAFQIEDGVYNGGLVWFILALVSIIFYTMITPYIFLHYAYIDLKSFQILKNSMLMTFAYLPRSFMGGVMGGAMWIIMALQFPNSLLAFPFVVLIFVSISLLMTLSWIWPPFNKYFDIEETLKKRLEEKEDNEEKAD